LRSYLAALAVTLCFVGALAPPGAATTLREDAIASVGGVGLSGAGLHLSLTGGQSVIGIGTDSALPSHTEIAGFWRFGILPTLDVPTAPEAPITAFALERVSPNPVSSRANIRYAIPQASPTVPVDLRLFDISGRVVRVLELGMRGGGLHTVAWDGTDTDGRALRSGIYFLRIHAGTFAATRRIVLAH
jgi:hypothetical protein